MKNWKTTLFGVLAIVFTFTGPVLEAYYPVRGLNWVAVMTALAGVAGGTGLLVAKDSTTHSTEAQTAAAQALVEGKPEAHELLKAANDQVKEKEKL